MLSTVSAGEFNEPGILFGMYQSSAIVYFATEKQIQKLDLVRIFRSFERTDLKKISLRPNSHHQLVKSRTKVIKNGCFMKIF